MTNGFFAHSVEDRNVKHVRGVAAPALSLVVGAKDFIEYFAEGVVESLQEFKPNERYNFVEVLNDITTRNIIKLCIGNDA